jgi:cellulose synthase/poly-beta-1,6-N-acetylglucosamine synthase-like glycosyltransferase
VTSRPENPDAAQAVDAHHCTSHGDLLPYSAPPGLLARRPAGLAAGLVLSFAAAALGIHLILQRLTLIYGKQISDLAGDHHFALPKQASIAVRPLTIALLLLFSLFAAGSIRARVRLAATALAIYLPLMIITDVLLARWARHGGPSPFMARGNIFDGIAGIVAACLAVFATARLPATLRIKAVVRRPKYYIAVFLASIAAAVASVAVLFDFESPRLHEVSELPLLGGLYSVVVFFFTMFPIYLILFGYLAGRLAAGRGTEAHKTRADEAGADEAGAQEAARLSDTSQLTFAFLVPAHNEEGRIGDCIRAIDIAASKCPGQAKVYIVENGSSDNTYEEASQALAECRYVRGELLISATQHKSHAKAHALNTGLFAATEQIIVRVDADTFVSATLLQRMAPYFLDPRVGGVGTIPLPHKVTTWIERMRSLEVYYGAAFKRTSQGAVDAIPVLPGATVAFRRDILHQLHGFSEGIRGEDADVTVRVGRLGYRIVSDPAIKVFSEQPQNLRELREQRMRWSSGLFHMIGRNRAAIYGLQGLRGVWTLPWACFVMFRKLMLIPFAVAAIGLVILSHSFLPVREISAAGAIVLGAQLVMMGLVVSVLGGPALLFSLPSYMVFRLVVTYFSLETLLTIRLKEPRWPPPPERLAQRF